MPPLCGEAGSRTSFDDDELEDNLLIQADWSAHKQACQPQWMGGRGGGGVRITNPATTHEVAWYHAFTPNTHTYSVRCTYCSFCSAKCESNR